MRKITLLIALTIFGLTQANAQNFGFKGGYNYSSFNGDVAKDNTLKGLSGFYVGALLELPLGDDAVFRHPIRSRRGGKNQALHRRAAAV